LILDFWELDKLVEPIIAEVDHRCLNDIKGLENPTAELISAWLWDRIESELAYGGGDTEFDVTEIRVWETPTSCAILKRGEEQ
jgi:6-pyruvoyltetrahydropterin/6-carboxytetrahydropterin synthase